MVAVGVFCRYKLLIFNAALRLSLKAIEGNLKHPGLPSKNTRVFRVKTSGCFVPKHPGVLVCFPIFFHLIQHNFRRKNQRLAAYFLCKYRDVVGILLDAVCLFPERVGAWPREAKFGVATRL